jgi:acetyl esterase/lipase
MCKDFFVLVLSLIAAIPGSAVERPNEFKDLTYLSVDGQDLKLDVYQNPRRQASPVLLCFHGGAWTTGTRPKDSTSFASFLGLGFSVVSVDYRLSGVATAPAAVQDARCAVSWTAAHAETYRFDTSRIVVYGTSAGAHLALMAGLLPSAAGLDLPQCKDIPTPAAILDFFGPTDLTHPEAEARTSPGATKWLNVVPGREDIPRQMSPLTYVRAGVPPVLLIHGDADPTVGHSHSVRMQRALADVGVKNRLYTVPGGQHGRFSEEQKLAVMRAVREFLLDVGVIGKEK